MDHKAIEERLGLSLNYSGYRHDKFRREKHWPDALTRLRLLGYARVSDDRKGKQKSVTEQSDDIIKAALVKWTQERDRYRILTDNSISASSHADPDIARPEFDKLVNEMATFGAVDIIIVWAVNRISRRHAEGLQFMWLCWVNDVRIHVLKARKTYDLRNNDDWDTLDREFKKAEDESDSKSQDIERGHAGNRDKGKAAGEWPGGWTRRYDPVTRDPSNEVVLAEARVLVTMVMALADGAAPSTVARRLNRDGVPPFTKLRKDGTKRPNKWGTWSGESVRRCALNPAHIGMIRRNPLRSGRRPDLSDSELMPSTAYFPIVRGPRDGEAWTAEERAELGWAGTEEEWIEEWKAARDKVVTPTVARTVRDGRPGHAYISRVRPGGSAHMQSFLSRCDVCGGPLRFAPYRPGITYLTCERSGHVWVREDWADEYVTELVVAKLAELTSGGGYSIDPGAATRLAENRRQRKAAEDYAESMRPVYHKKKDQRATEQFEAQHEAELAELDAEAEQLQIPAVIREYLECKGDRAAIAAKWAGKHVSGRRADLLGLTDSIRVRRSPVDRRVVLRLSEAQRRAVARGQVRVEWAREFVQAGDAVTAVDGGERIRAIPEDPDPATWGIAPEGWKWCSGECRQMLPADLEHFYKAPDTERTKPTADGLMNVCKVCHRARVSRRKAEQKARRAGAA